MSQESTRFEYPLNLFLVFIPRYAQRKTMSHDTSIDKGRLFLAFFSPQASTSILEEPETARRVKEKQERQL